MGECYSFANSQPDAESFAVSCVNSIRNTFSIPIGDICVSCFQPCSEYAGKLDVCTEELTGRDAKSHPETKAVNATYCSCAL